MIPPHSGYELPEGVKADYVSPCKDQNGIDISSSNWIRTNAYSGGAAVKLNSLNREKFPSYINVVISSIASVFIENINDVINVQAGSVTKVRFYVQDSYGRLFRNKL